ncbi:MAG: ATP-binding protein [Anaerolineae bacterium]|nr:ATP-binding protein [Anaerolineae bacterium]
MRIAVASGKGGTGKTTVAVSLFKSLALLAPERRPPDLRLLDCDVEEPNAALFLSTAFEVTEDVGILLPEVDFDRCTYCGRCAEVCLFHAIAVFGNQLLVFPELCHGCGSCAYNCPEHAITERRNTTGRISWGRLPGEANVWFGQGELNVGEAMANPVIRRLKETVGTTGGQDLTILDAPPGNACPVVETMRGADFVLLVTEPTPFGLHDLRVAVQVATEELGIPAGVVINRDGVGDDSVDAFCAETHIPILLRIPLDRRIAEAYADGVVLSDALPEYQEMFVGLYEQIRASVGETVR